MLDWAVDGQGFRRFDLTQFLVSQLSLRELAGSFSPAAWGSALLPLTSSIHTPILQRELYSCGCGSAAGAQVAGDVQ